MQKMLDRFLWRGSPPVISICVDPGRELNLVQLAVCMTGRRSNKRWRYLGGTKGLNSKLTIPPHIGACVKLEGSYE